MNVIDVPLWERAVWKATAYAFVPTVDEPLLIAVFDDRVGAQTIFDGLVEHLGNNDEKEELRVSVVVGVDRANPSYYRVVIGANPGSDVTNERERVKVFSRVNTMTPAGAAVSLDRFLAQFGRIGRYYLLGAVLDASGQKVEPFCDRYIMKSELRVVPAWQIDLDDLDICAVHADDDPVIPHGVTDVPFVRVRDWKRSSVSHMRQALTGERARRGT
jgi:hypothetical protein